MFLMILQALLSTIISIRLALSAFERHISHATLSAASELLPDMLVTISMMLTIESAGSGLEVLCSCELLSGAVLTKTFVVTSESAGLIFEDLHDQSANV